MDITKFISSQAIQTNQVQIMLYDSQNPNHFRQWWNLRDELNAIERESQRELDKEYPSSAHFSLNDFSLRSLSYFRSFLIVSYVFTLGKKHIAYLALFSLERYYYRGAPGVGAFGYLERTPKLYRNKGLSVIFPSVIKSLPHIFLELDGQALDFVGVRGLVHVSNSKSLTRFLSDSAQAKYAPLHFYPYHTNVLYPAISQIDHCSAASPLIHIEHNHVLQLVDQVLGHQDFVPSNFESELLSHPCHLGVFSFTFPSSSSSSPSSSSLSFNLKLTCFVWMLDHITVHLDGATRLGAILLHNIWIFDQSSTNIKPISLRQLPAPQLCRSALSDLCSNFLDAVRVSFGHTDIVMDLNDIHHHQLLSLLLQPPPSHPQVQPLGFSREIGALRFSPTVPPIAPATLVESNHCWFDPRHLSSLCYFESPECFSKKFSSDFSNQLNITTNQTLSSKL